MEDKFTYILLNVILVNVLYDHSCPLNYVRGVVLISVFKLLQKKLAKKKLLAIVLPKMIFFYYKRRVLYQADDIFNISEL